MYAGDEHKLMCASQHGLRESTVQLEQGSMNSLHIATLWPKRVTQLPNGSYLGGREGSRK